MSEQALSNKGLILVVDDDRSTLLMLETALTKIGFEVIKAMDGKLACELITRYNSKIDVILLDREIPIMKGMEIVRWLKSNNKIFKPPIIMQTGQDKSHEIKEAIDEGVFYYLTKPIQVEILQSIVLSAVKESRLKKFLRTELGKHRGSFKILERALFYPRTIFDIENLTCFLANIYPDPDKIFTGIADLLINALEHGNLGISFHQKGQLIEHGKWRSEIERLTNLPENRDKKIEVLFFKEDNKYFLKISDNGKGFNWHKYLNADPSRGLENHGRGISRANMIFSNLEYNREGNQVLAIYNLAVNNEIDW